MIESESVSVTVSPAGYRHQHLQPLSAASKPLLSARDLTGAPLISLVPCKNRKARPGPSPAPRKYLERQRHSSDQAAIPSSYYAGQNLYQVRYYQYEGQREYKVSPFFRSWWSTVAILTCRTSIKTRPLPTEPTCDNNRQGERKTATSSLLSADETSWRVPRAQKTWVTPSVWPARRRRTSNPGLSDQEGETSRPCFLPADNIWSLAVTGSLPAQYPV